MQTTDDTTGPTIDWRDWIAFLGYVLAAAVVISVALASVVLIVSTQADDALPLVNSPPPRAAVAAPAELNSPASAPVGASSIDKAAQTAAAFVPSAVPNAATPEIAPPTGQAVPMSSAVALAGPAAPLTQAPVSIDTAAPAALVPAGAATNAAVAAPISASNVTRAVAVSGPAVSFAAAADRDPRSPPTGNGAAQQ